MHGYPKSARLTASALFYQCSADGLTNLSLTIMYAGWNVSEPARHAQCAVQIWYELNVNSRIIRV